MNNIFKKLNSKLLTSFKGLNSQNQFFSLGKFKIVKLYISRIKNFWS